MQGPQVGRFAIAEPEGLRITLPKNRVKRDAVGFYLPLEVKGDFEATASFEVLRAQAPESGYGVGVTMGVDDRARVGRYVRANATQWIVWDFWPVVDGVRKMEAGALPCIAKEGRIRLKRTGTVLYFLWAPESSGDFQEIHKTEFGDDDTRFFSFVAESGGQPRALDVRVLEFRVRGIRTNVLPWLIGAVAVVAVLGAGLLVRGSQLRSARNKIEAR